jgi:hypothetical protein
MIRVMTAVVAIVCGPLQAAEAPAATRGVAEQGQAILKEMIEVNRYWLVGPPEAVGHYSYSFHLNNREPLTVNVEIPGRTGQAQRQGITWYSTLQTLARKPAQAVIREISETNGVVALSMRLEPGVRGHCGNGIEGTWSGYFNLGGDFAEVLVDLKRKVPLRSVLGNLVETYGEFVEVDSGHLVPLCVTVQREDSMRFDWKFRLYQPGLWLLDFSEYGGRKVAWVDGVQIGDATARAQNATAVSVQREAAERAGSARLEQFLAANRNWLLPSLEARRGLVYDYAQEGGYRERVMFDPEGNLMVRLESSKEAPDKPTRERLWTIRGQKLEADHGDPFVQETDLAEAVRSAGSGAEAWLRTDRAVQHLAMGLGLECALTRLAREPEAFGAEVLPIKEEPGRYLLVLQSRKNTRLFAGTMLMFTSWAYMHDVNFSRSEIVCDATTHRPIKETDFDEAKVVGDFRFEDWIAVGTGSAPGKIRAVVPYEKENQDNSLELNAQFHVARPGVWLVNQVESSFRGDGGSTGRVQVATLDAKIFEPIQDLSARQKTTENILRRMASGKPGLELDLPLGNWQDVALAAKWTAAAEQSAAAREDRKSPAMPPLIGIYRARASAQPGGSMRLELEGITTTAWKEFQTEWTASAVESGRKTTEARATANVRTEGAPGAFTVQLDLPTSPDLRAANSLKVTLEGTVRRMTAGYHGHGIWFRLAGEK